MSMRMRGALVGCVTVGAFAAPTHLAVGTTVHLSGPDPRFGSPGEVLVNAGSARNHSVEVSYEAARDAFVITDSRGLRAFDDGCTRLGPDRVRCESPAPEGPASVSIAAGKGDDKLRTDATVGGFVTLDGGNGRNVLKISKRASGGGDLSGGRGRDRILGGAGRDSISDYAGRDVVRGRGGGDIVFVDLRSQEQGGRNRIFGGGGGDLILAKNGHGRDEIDCGRGDDEARLDRVDPKPRACENVRRHRPRRSH
jgi:hypothetical protein